MFSAISTFIANKIAVVRIVAFTTILLSVFGGLWYQNHQLESAKEDKKVALHDRDVAIENLGKVVEINAKNQITIKQMQQDQVVRDKLQRELKVKMTNDKEQIDSLLAQINYSGPQDDAPAAPILRKTIESIQKIRESRENGDENK